jgi:hypothetical protein
MAKRSFSSRPRSDEITSHGYKALTFAKCATVMTVMLMVTNGLGSSQVYLVWDGIGMILVLPVLRRMIYRTPFVDHTLRILIQLNWVVLVYNFNIEDRC